MVEAAVSRGFEIAGAVDIDPQIAGKSLAQICPGAPTDVVVAADLAEACARSEPDAAVLTTVSSLVAARGQIEVLASKGVPVVSTCEELSFPWEADPGTAKEIDESCRAGGVACLGTGVNPGYLMDFLPTVLSAPCLRVDAVQVWRVQDASARRVPFQQKIGAGLDSEQFEQKREEGVLRHVGLRESAGYIASSLGWSLDGYEETLEPVVADTPISAGYAPIEPGQARGVLQIGRGYCAGSEIITLTFRAAVGEPESYERVRIEGIPELEWRCEGGINGDVATCAVTLNAVRSVLSAQPGLRTMADIRPVTFGPAGEEL
jgi:4-hydroxy-tetrahydrodipicolinate reductase